MYNLTVAQDHTYVVGVGKWVVHNCGGAGGDGVGFSDQSKLIEHFDKHNAEFSPPFANKTDYEEAATDFMTQSQEQNPNLHEGIRNNGDIVRIDDSIGQFVIQRGNYISTFFIPDPAKNGGLSPVDYFLNQIDDLIF